MSGYGTTEAIQRAHAREVHPAAGDRVHWDSADLEWPAPPEQDGTEQTGVLRITYAAANGQSPDRNSDYLMAVLTSDIEDMHEWFALASAISRHSQVFAVAVYLKEPTTGYPFIAYQSGDPIAFN